MKPEAMTHEYGEGKWWGHVIQEYAVMRSTLKGQGLEQNHLVHAAFFRNGPAEVRDLVGRVPCLTLSMEEHRGAKFSYHKMKDGQRVGEGKDAFEGCGMDAYLRSRKIEVDAGSFTRDKVSAAIDASADYWKEIGMDHCAAAVREFKRVHFDKTRPVKGD